MNNKNNYDECCKCANFESGACPFFVKGKGTLIGKRVELIENHNADCFVTSADKKLCDMFCGGIERW